MNVKLFKIINEGKKGIMEVWLNQSENLKKIKFDILNSVSTFECIKIDDLTLIGDYQELLKILKEEGKSTYLGANIFFAKQLWSFAYEIRIGDYIVVPMNDKHKLVIGEVFGGYEFKISYPESIRHSIPVSWKGVFRYQSEQIVKAVSIPCQLRKLKGHMIQERILWPLMANPNHLWNQNDK